MKQIILIFVFIACAANSHANPFRRYAAGALYGITGHQFARFTDRANRGTTTHGTFSGAILSTFASGMSTSLAPNKTALLNSLRAAAVVYTALRTMDYMGR